MIISLLHSCRELREPASLSVAFPQVTGILFSPCRLSFLFFQQLLVFTPSRDPGQASVAMVSTLKLARQLAANWPCCAGTQVLPGSLADSFSCRRSGMDMGGPLSHSRAVVAVHHLCAPAHQRCKDRQRGVGTEWDRAGAGAQRARSNYWVPRGSTEGAPVLPARRAACRAAAVSSCSSHHAWG